MVKDNLSSHLDLIHQWKRFTRNPMTTRCYSGGGPFSISIQKWHGSVSSQFGHWQFQFTSSPQLKNSDQYGRVGPTLASSEICSFASAAILATSQGTLKLSQVPTTDYSDSRESIAKRVVPSFPPSAQITHLISGKYSSVVLLFIRHASYLLRTSCIAYLGGTVV